MEYINAEAVKENLNWESVITSLREMFAEGCETPLRHHHSMEVPGQSDGTMLIMPAWAPGKYSGIKVLNIYPDNADKGIPGIHGVFLLMDGQTGEPSVLMDAGELTARRTSAASALASTYLSRKDSSRLLIMGSGRQAKNLGLAHSTVRPIEEIQVWAHQPEMAEETAQHYRDHGFNAKTIDVLEEGVRWADIICGATMSESPLILGEWVSPGTHIDLIGGYTPVMRETDDDIIQKSSVYVDTREGALAEAGDLLIPINNGNFSEDQVLAELSELSRGEHKGRVDDEEITLFKSVGTSLEDLAAAITCYKNHSLNMG